MTKLILHAGFPKCGSTSIFKSFQRNLPQMAAENFFVFNDEFELPTIGKQLQTPLWELQKSRMSATMRLDVRAKISAQIKNSPKGSTVILSSEVLAPFGKKEMFAGIDDETDVEIIAYFRPQIDWYPSAWKQWEMREGHNLESSVASYLKQHKPSYLGAMARWKAVLPKAKITLRPFIRTEMVNQSPPEDFFSLIGFGFETLKTVAEVSNPSVDYALLHLLMRHHTLFFKNRHDSALMMQLVKHLPPEYLRTNAPMLTQQMYTQITEHFRAENLEILGQFLPSDRVDEYFQAHFTRSPIENSYPDMAENDVLERAAEILKDVFGISEKETTNNRQRLAESLRAVLISPN